MLYSNELERIALVAPKEKGVTRAFVRAHESLMLYRPLGVTGLTVSEIGFGCASWWGRREFSEADALRLVHVALERGVTLFDTGASYSKGEAEPRLGRALKGRPTDNLVIATKAGTRFAGGRIVRDMSAEAIEVSVVRSLERLGLDSLPLLQLHGPAIEELTDDFMFQMEGLKRRGLIRSLGLNSFDPAVIEAAIGLPDFDVVMVDYNVLRPDRAHLVAKAAAAGKGVLAGMALAMGHTGLQTLKLRAPRDIWYALRALKNHRSDIAKGARFGFLSRLSDMTGPQAALAYVLDDPGVSAAVVGTTRMEHLLENLDGSGRVLSEELRCRIRKAQS
jgi:aryl-alcohol dehydrogenase-like predicted oxidoreductase